MPDVVENGSRSPSQALSPDAPPRRASVETLRMLARAQAGDEAAAMILVSREAPSVRGWAHGRLPQAVRRDADTEDIVQDVVLRTLGRMRVFRHRTVGRLQAYLRAGVVNRIRDLLRAAGRRGVVITLTDDVHGTSPCALEEAIRHESLDRYLAALHRLRPADRQLIVWRMQAGHSVEEIAARMGKTKAAAGMSVTRAMARLARELAADATAAPS
jgi:RNA polymerase sigma factor (sigma-70 family)